MLKLSARIELQRACIVAILCPFCQNLHTHSTNSEMTDKEKAYKCIKREIVLENEQLLNEHKVTHSNDSPAKRFNLEFQNSIPKP